MKAKIEKAVPRRKNEPLDSVDTRKRLLGITANR